MRVLSRSVICCIAITACSTDPTLPVSPPKDLGASLAATAATWNPILLNPGPTYASLAATALSNRGHIAGYEVSVIPGADPFIQRLGQRRYLALPVGLVGVVPAAINDFGVMVGRAYSPTNVLPVVYRDSDQPSFVPGVARGYATDVSETGWIVGTAIFLNPFRFRAFVWRPGMPNARILGANLPDSIWTTASGVNNAGYIAGQVGNRPAIWTPQGTLEPIPLPLNVTDGSASEINDAMQVVGTVSFFSEPITAWGGRRGFLWRQGQPMVLLHWLPEFSSLATDIDRRGRVYGFVKTDTYYPAVWVNGTWSILPEIVYYSWLYDVNDCGVGAGSGDVFGVLWLTEC